MRIFDLDRILVNESSFLSRDSVPFSSKTLCVVVEQKKNDKKVEEFLIFGVRKVERVPCVKTGDGAELGLLQMSFLSTDTA